MTAIGVSLRQALLGTTVAISSVGAFSGLGSATTMAQIENANQLLLLLSAEEITAVDAFQRKRMLPSRAAAVREIVRMSLGISARGNERAAEGLGQRLPMTKLMTRPWHRAKRPPSST